MDHQDWNTVTIKTKNAAVLSAGGSRTIQTRSGAAASAGSHTRKLDQDTEGLVRPKMLSPESKQQLIQTRLALKKTQKELDQMCSFPPNTIQALEAGRRAPSNGELQTLNRVLKTGLKLA